MKAMNYTWFKLEKNRSVKKKNKNYFINVIIGD